MMQVNLYKLLPVYFQQIKDYEALMSTEEIELAQIEDSVTKIYNNLFLQLADSATISYYESLFKIASLPSEPLEFRRWRVLNRFRSGPPYTMPKLKEFLNEVVGIGLWEIEQDLANYYIKITVKNSGYGVLEEVQTMMLEIIPAHIVQEVEQQFLPEPTTTVYYGGTSSIGVQYTLS